MVVVKGLTTTFHVLGGSSTSDWANCGGYGSWAGSIRDCSSYETSRWDLLAGALVTHHSLYYCLWYTNRPVKQLLARYYVVFTVGLCQDTL